MSREERAAHFDAMNATIALLHSYDPEAIGLGDYGKATGFVERQVARWSKQYLSDTDAGRVPAMDRLVDWLGKHLPPDSGRSSVVHGDFRCDNMIFDAEQPVVRAVLDWELSTLGDPAADFTYHLLMYRMPGGPSFSGLAGMDLEALGIPSEEDYVAAYCRRTGRDHLPEQGLSDRLLPVPARGDPPRHQGTTRARQRLVGACRADGRATRAACRTRLERGAKGAALSERLDD